MPAVGDHVKDEIEEEDTVVDPHGYEDDEVRPSNLIVQPQCQQNEKNQHDEPRKQRSMVDGHVEFVSLENQSSKNALQLSIRVCAKRYSVHNVNSTF